MKRFKNILYHADGDKPSGESLNRAVSLAKSNDARLTVIDVIEEADLADDVQQRYQLNLQDMLRQRRLEQLHALLEPHQGSGLDIQTEVITGTPFIELILHIQHNAHDLLIKAPHPPEGLTQRLFYGSFDLHLLRKCPCPVWIDRPESAHPYRHILAAVDPMDAACNGLNRLILDLASSLAERESAQLHVVHAWEMPGESMLRSGRARISITEVERLLAETEQTHRQRLDDLLRHYDLSSEDSRISLVKQSAAKAITSLARELNADLIVMGTVGRTGLPGLIIGNTAEDILQTTQASVLAVKPDGFVSPVSMP
ncbi:MAG: universal stress protein [Gammaproteobacteria bacterium]|nr:universal stress protein [Gammaproteobacteria bacterium]